MNVRLDNCNTCNSGRKVATVRTPSARGGMQSQCRHCAPAAFESAAQGDIAAFLRGDVSPPEN
jgi:hypothetical protein